MSMNQFRISTRLYLLVGSLIGLSVVLGLLGLGGIYQANEAMRAIYQERALPLTRLQELQYYNVRNRVLVMDMMLHYDPAHFDKRNTELKSNLKTFSALEAELMAMPLDKADKDALTTFFAHYKTFVNDGLLTVARLVDDGQRDVAQQIYDHTISPMAATVRKELNELIQRQVKAVDITYEAARASYRMTLFKTIAALALSTALGAFFGLALVKSIRGGLNRAVDATQAMAQGDFSDDIRANGNDEISHLLHALQQMQVALGDVVHRVRHGSEVVAHAAAEISQGNRDLSQRTSAQASALEQTAASMEELSVTVRQNADNASQANELAQRASHVAAQGGQVVSQVVGSMRDIHSRSQKIGEITSVIDGIAFQTNILALNAAVEAARAGEQGRGFAVVAGEVRSLAQRSAEAAKEIASLIRASLESVEQGSERANTAGTTMSDVVKAIHDVTTLMAEISRASAEQSMGVGQIGAAVTSMEGATQQNAALVDQLAGSASHLNDEAGTLVQTVSIFRLPSNGPALGMNPARGLLAQT